MVNSVIRRYGLKGHSKGISENEEIEKRDKEKHRPMDLYPEEKHQPKVYLISYPSFVETTETTNTFSYIKWPLRDMIKIDTRNERVRAKTIAADVYELL